MMSLLGMSRLKQPDTVRPVLPMRTSVTQSGRWVIVKYTMLRLYIGSSY